MNEERIKRLLGMYGVHWFAQNPPYPNLDFRTKSEAIDCIASIVERSSPIVREMAIRRVEAQDVLIAILKEKGDAVDSDGLRFTDGVYTSVYPRILRTCSDGGEIVAIISMSGITVVPTSVQLEAFDFFGPTIRFYDEYFNKWCRLL